MQTSYVIHAGQYKARPNGVITRYGDRFEYASPEETPGLMADLVDWYNKAEQEGRLSPVELAALFHYRYIRIHPFEDGNGRIARLVVNFILTRHNYPMVVVRSRKKNEYLEALHQTDLEVGSVPSDGAHAEIKDIRPFLKYFNNLVATVRKSASEVPLRACNSKRNFKDAQPPFHSGWRLRWFDCSAISLTLRRTAEAVSDAAHRCPSLRSGHRPLIAADG